VETVQDRATAEGNADIHELDQWGRHWLSIDQDSDKDFDKGRLKGPQHSTSWHATSVGDRPENKLFFRSAMSSVAALVTARSETESFPPGLNNAYFFAVFNALSFQVVLASPMVLYAKTLGASATVLGIIAGMMPLLVILQIPAAGHVDRVGYKRFVYAGWGMRVGFIFVIALVPLAAFLDATTRLALILTLLFCFNISRGISSAAWLPWIASLVPASIRGRYLAGDQAAQAVASVISFVLSGLCLGLDPAPWRFAALFGFSAAMGAVSLVFLKRIPDATPPEHARGSNTPVPWGEMIRFRPFHRLLCMVVGWSIAYGGMGTFTVAFLRVEAGMPEGRILILNSTAYVGALASLWLFGSRLDGWGSKPVLGTSLAAWFAVLLGWFTLAGRVVTPGLGVVIVLQVLMGLFAAAVAMANARLVMAITPALGRNHFFAIYSVVSSGALGLAPIGWGLLIDGVGTREGVWLGVTWTRYTVFFAGVALVYLVTLGLATRLEEPKAASMEKMLRELLIHSPHRALARLWLKS
jgi:MFS family permease